jgi:hypothetical protein
VVYAGGLPIAEREAAIKERDAERAEKTKLAVERERLQGLYEHVHHLLRKANDVGRHVSCGCLLPSPIGRIERSTVLVSTSAAGNRTGAGWRLGDPLAISARELLTHVIDDLPVPRFACQRF